MRHFNYSPSFTVNTNLHAVVFSLDLLLKVIANCWRFPFLNIVSAERDNNLAEVINDIKLEGNGIP